MILRRLLLMPVLLLVIYTVTFVLAWMIPGNPLQWPEQRRPSAQVEQAMKERYNLDNPVRFYWQYLDRVVTRGDFGPSLHYQDWTVGEILKAALPVSVQLGLAAIVMALLIGTGAGVVGALRPGTLLDHATLSLALVGISLPTFVTGSALLILFAVWIPLLPVGGWGSVSQLIGPAFVLSLPFAAYIARLTRLGMVEVMTSDFIRTARAKGLPMRRVVMYHAMKVAFLPVLSFLGPAAAAAMTGSFVVEKVFNIPGMGQHFVDAVLNKDLFLIMGVVLVYAAMLIVFNLLVDLAYTLVDPRIDPA
ncbi:MAG: ABC transporter permease [Phycisphaeraceae bacterium]